MITDKAQTFSTLDVYLSAFLSLHGIPLTLQNSNGRIAFNFPADDQLYKLMSAYNSNGPVPVVDFVTRIKTLRGQLLTMRGAQA